jgi:hypothetical protein
MAIIGLWVIGSWPEGEKGAATITAHPEKQPFVPRILTAWQFFDSLHLLGKLAEK